MIDYYSTQPSYATKAEAVLDSLELANNVRKTILFPHRRKCANTLVISRQSVNSWFNQNKTKLRILILTIPLQMLSYSNSLHKPHPPKKRTTFLIRWYKSSGISGASPPAFKIRRILLPVTNRTCGIPCESLNTTPIWEGVIPRRASLWIWSTTSVEVVLSQEGGRRE